MALGLVVRLWKEKSVSQLLCIRFLQIARQKMQSTLARRY